MSPNLRLTLQKNHKGLALIFSGGKQIKVKKRYCLRNYYTTVDYEDQTIKTESLYNLNGMSTPSYYYYTYMYNM